MGKEMTINKKEIYQQREKRKSSFWYEIKKHRFVYMLLSPALLMVFIFSYLPMPGLSIAFMDFNIYEQWASPWVGLQNIIELFRLPAFTGAIFNTLKISLLMMAVSFPAPIIFALMLNELKNEAFKRFVQTISYLPYFLSWISVVGIVMSVYNINGPINDLRVALMGGERVMFLARQDLFIPNVLILDLWKGLGWGTIIYLAAITGIDPSLYEAARIDGASKWKQVIHITIPSISSTIIILLIWKVGSLFGDNFELIYGLQNPFISFDVISTIIFKNGIQGGQFSIATAFGFVQGIVNFLILMVVNQVAKKYTEVSVW